MTETLSWQRVEKWNPKTEQLEEFKVVKLDELMLWLKHQIELCDAFVDRPSTGFVKVRYEVKGQKIAFARLRDVLKWREYTK